ncbi:MAG: hypothetical protein ABIA02_02405 [Candidatus Falkowbacteria bacterium]
MYNKKTIIIIGIVISALFIISNIYFAAGYYSVAKELQATQVKLKTQQLNEKALNFAQLFIVKVLKAEGEVSFEDRLKLENAIRDLADDKILTQWNTFVESQTEEQAQEEVKNLLEMLINKISIK